MARDWTSTITSDRERERETRRKHTNAVFIVYPGGNSGVYDHNHGFNSFLLLPFDLQSETDQGRER